MVPACRRKRCAQCLIRLSYATQAPSEYGIHLMACFFIVHHHGGKIEARTKPGQGTTFTLHLPLQAEPVSISSSDTDFLRKALLNENLWEKLLTSA